MTPQEAADLVRQHWDSHPPPLSPEKQHEVHFLMEVCRCLGKSPDPVNTAHVASLLEGLQVARHTGDEYPKALLTTDDQGKSVAVYWSPGHEKAGLPVVFDSAEEEMAYFERTPTNVAGRPDPNMPSGSMS